MKAEEKARRSAFSSVVMKAYDQNDYLIYYGEINKTFSKLNDNNVPANAILFVMAISLIIPFFGRTAVSWIIDVDTVGATIAYCYTSAAAFFLASKENNLLIKITGLIGAVISIVFNLFLLKL